jgi:glutathione synthase/RimK-type ligase-like ATP-grasp enzyme
LAAIVCNLDRPTRIRYAVGCGFDSIDFSIQTLGRGVGMPSLQELRRGKPGTTPDQSIYAEYACAEFGLTFQDIDGGTGLVFSVASASKSITFGAGRCSWYPQNNATAASLATDKYFASIILERAGIPTLGGQYFFLHDRHRAHRPPGHERSDALAYFRTLGNSAFAKPLTGSRGDFAEAIDGEAALLEYLDRISRIYDSVLIQPIVSGIEQRIFLLDDEMIYCARKVPPSLAGDGVSSIHDLLAKHNAALQSRGLSAAAIAGSDESLDRVLAKGERWEIPGRMNLSAGGSMILEAPRAETTVALARRAAEALGLRVAAVDLFTDIDGTAGAVKIIEVNSNPSIRLLEQSDRGDLILKIWHHSFAAMGLL